jgi:integrase
MLIDAGIDVVMVSRRLGHANPAITLAIYRINSAPTIAAPPMRSTRRWRV